MIIQLKHVTLRYGQLEIVKDINLNVKQGETKIILGPSGVGKSTILKAILGLLRPAAGEIFVEGQEISNLRERDLVRVRLKMAMVFQHGALFDSMTVGDNVSYRLRELGLADKASIEKRMREVLKFVGMEHAVGLKPAELSGGMKKRVAIARALAPDPDIFLFDEPTVGLDPINFFNVEQLIVKLQKKQKATIIIVTHDVESAMRLADSIVMLHDRKFIFEGSPAELQRHEDKRVRAFLDPASVYSSD